MNKTPFLFSLLFNDEDYIFKTSELFIFYIFEDYILTTSELFIF